MLVILYSFVVKYYTLLLEMRSILVVTYVGDAVFYFGRNLYWQSCILFCLYIWLLSCDLFVNALC